MTGAKAKREIKENKIKENKNFIRLPKKKKGALGSLPV
jgi:hypothetical protein